MKLKILGLLCGLLFIFHLTNNSASAQVFPNLESNSSKFEQISKNLSLSFPRDHGMHPKFQLEWWYLTANLIDENGNDRGLQWTLFRFALDESGQESSWDNSQIWMGHAAVTDRNSHYFAEKFARGGVQQAGVTMEPFNAWIDDWNLKGKTWEQLQASAAGTNFKYQINLESFGPIIQHGDNGYSLKSSEGHASAYYSQPFFLASGWIELNGRRQNVTGTAWMDHEWSSQFLSKSIDSWDWFSLNFDSGDKLMLFRVEGGSKEYFYAGTWIHANGEQKQLDPADISLEPLSKNNPNIRPQTIWNIKVKSLGVDIQTTALNEKAFMETLFSYWEGPIKSRGTHNGVGYLEMTGF